MWKTESWKQKTGILFTRMITYRYWACLFYLLERVGFTFKKRVASFSRNNLGEEPQRSTVCIHTGGQYNCSFVMATACSAKAMGGGWNTLHLHEASLFCIFPLRRIWYLNQCFFCGLIVFFFIFCICCFLLRLALHCQVHNKIGRMQEKDAPNVIQQTD